MAKGETGSAAAAVAPPAGVGSGPAGAAGKVGAAGKAGAVGAGAGAGSDPRMPSAARKYSPQFHRRLGLGKTGTEEDDLPPIDVPSLVGMVLGLFGVMLKQKLLCWIALLLAAQALVNMRSVDSDLKQILCCLSFAVMGLVSSYFGPTHPAATPAQTQ